MSESEQISKSELFSKSKRISKSKPGESATLPQTKRQKQVLGLRGQFFVPRGRKKPTGEKAESDRHNRFVVAIDRCSAPYIWGTVSVLLGFSWWITVSACLACFPYVSASLPAARPPCRAAIVQKPYFLVVFVDLWIVFRIISYLAPLQCAARDVVSREPSAECDAFIKKNTG